MVGWDDTPEAARADPPLTTIRQSLRDQGRLCAQLAAAGAPDGGRATAVGARGARVDGPLEGGVVYRYTNHMEYRRDRLTWTAYAMLAWFAYLQAAPGLVVPHLRDELGLGYRPAGCTSPRSRPAASSPASPPPRSSAHSGGARCSGAPSALLAAGAVALTLGHVIAATLGALLVMGIAGATLLITIQAALADRHGERRAIALSEANVAASVAYVVLIGALSLAAATGAGWRAALLASLAVPALAWWRTGGWRSTRRRRPAASAAQRCPRAFWVAAAMLFCTTAAEWCITAWGASFVEEAADVSADTAVSLMIGYFAGVVAGRTLGSALARRLRPTACSRSHSSRPPPASRSCGPPPRPPRPSPASPSSASASATSSRSGSRSPSASRRTAPNSPAAAPSSPARLAVLLAPLPSARSPTPPRSPPPSASSSRSH